MPLHLLGKKSWNVYNQDNIKRVRRDEAEAAAREAAEEQAMQEADAERRMKLLRGEPVDDQVNTETQPEPKLSKEAARRLGLETTYADRDRKRKRHGGEDDTDRDMRYAKQMVEDRPETDERRVLKMGRSDENVPIVDHRGNISLFQGPDSGSNAISKSSRDREEEKQSRKRQAQNEPPVMRLSDAAGRHGPRDSQPWYSSRDVHSTAETEKEPAGRDVWGNEDPGRKRRDQVRLTSDDPLALMKRGVQQVRKVEADRKKWREEQEADIEALKRDERRRKHHTSHHHDRSRGRDADQGLEDFSLDRVDGSNTGRHRHDGHHRRKHSRESRHRRRRDRSVER